MGTPTVAPIIPSWAYRALLTLSVAYFAYFDPWVGG